MTATDDKPDTTSDDASTSEVSTPEPVNVGDAVVKTMSPQVYDGIVLAVDTDALPEAVAYVIGRRTQGEGEFTLIASARANFVRNDAEGTADLPSIPEIGATFMARHKLTQKALEESKTALDAATTNLAAANDRLTTRNTEVRDTIISEAGDHSWDDDDVNCLLSELGLEGMTREWSVNVDVTATQSVYVTVEATSLDEAIEQVENDDDLVDGAIQTYEWSVDSREVDRYNSSAAD